MQAPNLWPGLQVRCCTNWATEYQKLVQWYIILNINVNGKLKEKFWIKYFSREAQRNCHSIWNRNSDLQLKNPAPTLHFLWHFLGKRLHYHTISTILILLAILITLVGMVTLSESQGCNNQTRNKSSKLTHHHLTPPIYCPDSTIPQEACVSEIHYLSPDCNFHFLQSSLVRAMLQFNIPYEPNTNSLLVRRWNFNCQKHLSNL